MNIPHAPTSDDFRRVMARFVTGVAVMTTFDGEPHGMTANAVTSVSLDPLLVLVCVEKQTEMARMVRASGHFALSILGADQQALSNHFADGSRSIGAAEFDGIKTTDALTGSPLIEGALAWLDCTVWAVHDGGDHHIVVGEVRACDVGGDGPALGYFRSGYVPVAIP